MKKIPTNAPQPGLNPAFSALQLDSLAPGPAEPSGANRRSPSGKSPAEGSPQGMRGSAEQSTATPMEKVWKMGCVVLQRETAHRGGKTVVVVQDFATHLPVTVIERVAKKLRAACGCGGTVKDRRIEIQGDQVSKIRLLLESEGFQVAGVR